MNDLTRIIQLPEVIDQRGSLSFFESNNQRTSILTDLSTFKEKDYACKNQEEFLVVLSGSVNIRIRKRDFDGVFLLNKPNFGLYIPKMAWRSVVNFSPNSILLVLGSDTNKENQYIKDFNEYLRILDNEKEYHREL